MIKIAIDRQRLDNDEPAIVVWDGDKVQYCDEVEGSTWRITSERMGRETYGNVRVWLETTDSVQTRRKQ